MGRNPEEKLQALVPSHRKAEAILSIHSILLKGRHRFFRRKSHHMCNMGVLKSGVPK